MHKLTFPRSRRVKSQMSEIFYGPMREIGLIAAYIWLADHADFQVFVIQSDYILTWNQILTWDSFNPSSWASSCLFFSVRYLDLQKVKKPCRGFDAPAVNELLLESLQLLSCECSSRPFLFVVVHPGQLPLLLLSRSRTWSVRSQVSRRWVWVWVWLTRAWPIRVTCAEDPRWKVVITSDRGQ